MFKMLLQYISDRLIQRKDKNIRWINSLHSGLGTTISGIDFTKRQLSLWKHLLTASRDGCKNVRAMHYLNMFLKILFTGLGIALWHFLSKWFFTDFHLFSYMDVNGNFWEAIVVIGAPLMLLHFLLVNWIGLEVVMSMRTEL